jgi:hypothetical protein
MSEWISVEDELPNDESGYKVLVSANDIVGQWVEILNYNGKCWIVDGGVEYPAIVTHWMPLPKPPTQ